MTSSVKKRNGEVDFLKFLFSIIIVFVHSIHLANEGESSLFPRGMLSVEFFFIVSGYLMAATVEKNRAMAEENSSLGKETFGFMKHKVVGLLPNYYVAWIIAFIVAHLFSYDPSTIVHDLGNSIWELLMISEIGLRGYIANGVTWYISAMLIAMLLLYPIMRKCGKTYYFLWAPIIFLLLMGETYINWKNYYLDIQAVSMGFLKSEIRAVICLVEGSMCYMVVKYLKKQNFTIFGSVLLGILEFCCFMVTIVYMAVNINGRLSQALSTRFAWVLIILYGIGITIAFSQKGICNGLFNHKIFNWLGEFSFSLYLGHGFWSRAIPLLMPNNSYYERLALYIPLGIVTGLFIMYVSKGLRAGWKKWGGNIRGLVIAK